MKTKYEAPEINVLKLSADDVIATSSTQRLKPEDVFTPTGGGTSWTD